MRIRELLAKGYRGSGSYGALLEAHRDGEIPVYALTTVKGKVQFVAFIVRLGTQVYAFVDQRRVPLDEVYTIVETMRFQSQQERDAELERRALIDSLEVRKPERRRRR